MRSSYNTNSKKLILEEAMNIKNNFTAKDIKNRLDNNNHIINMTTIYRILDNYVEEGILKKYYNDSNTANYQYLADCHNENHYFLKCLNCGKNIHVDCDCINEFSSHILKKHDFNLKNNHLLLMGYCKECSKKVSK